ncbi:glycerophosphodiester phosphodiesterase [Polycladomyces zharkentensis]
MFAHRGSSAAAPENTMAAFELAVKAGAGGVELDVQLTRDGRVVVIHDETLDRTTNGSGWVKDHEWETLRRLDAGSWWNPRFSSERIPLLEDVLDLLSNTDMIINIELKNGWVRYPGLETAVLACIDRFRMAERVILSSFNHNSLRMLRGMRPELSLAALYESGLFEPWVYARYLGVHAIHPDWRAIDETVVKGCQSAGIAVRPYTVDDPEMMQQFIAWGVDGIITNYPERCRQVLDGRPMKS